MDIYGLGGDEMKTLRIYVEISVIVMLVVIGTSIYWWMLENGAKSEEEIVNASFERSSTPAGMYLYNGTNIVLASNLKNNMPEIADVYLATHYITKENMVEYAKKVGINDTKVENFGLSGNWVIWRTGGGFFEVFTDKNINKGILVKYDIGNGEGIPPEQFITDAETIRIAFDYVNTTITTLYPHAAGHMKFVAGKCMEGFKASDEQGPELLYTKHVYFDIYYDNVLLTTQIDVYVGAQRDIRMFSAPGDFIFEKYSRIRLGMPANILQYFLEHGMYVSQKSENVSKIEITGLSCAYGCASGTVINVSGEPHMLIGPSVSIDYTVFYKDGTTEKSSDGLIANISALASANTGGH